MSYFTPRQVKRVDLSVPGYWVDVVTDLKYGEMKGQLKNVGDGTVNAVSQFDNYLLSVIDSWNLDDENGNTAPVDAEHIDKLNQQDAINVINASVSTAPSKEEDKDFLLKSDLSTAQNQ